MANEKKIPAEKEELMDFSTLAGTPEVIAEEQAPVQEQEVVFPVAEKKQNTKAIPKVMSVETKHDVVPYQKRTVILKAIEKKNWAGFTRYPKCKDTIIAHQGRGGFHTGLTAESQAFLEKELQLAENELSPYSKYWLEYAIQVDNLKIELDLSRPKDLLDYYICMNSPRVSNSVTEMDNWPKAEYVLYDAEEDAKKENTEVRQRRIAFAKFGNMSTSELKDILKLASKKRPDNLSPTMIENEVDKLIQSNPKEFNRIADLANFKTRVLIEDLLNINAIRQSGTHFLVGDDAIGHDLESAIMYLEDPRNQNLLISLKNKLEAYA